MDRLKSTQILTGLGFCLFFLAFSSILLLMDYDEVYSYYITFLLFLGLGNLLFYKKARLFFNLAFFFNVFIGVCFVFSFYNANGVPFAGGGDDQYFYDLIILLLGNKPLPIVFVVSADYKGFIYTVLEIYRFLNLLGIDDSSYYHFVLINNFVGATVPPLLYQFGNYFYKKKIVFKAALTLCFFPFITFFSAHILRDIWVAALFLFALKLLFHPKMNLIFKLIGGLSTIAFSIIGIRPTTGMISLATWGSYLLFGKKYIKQKLIFLIASVIVALPLVDMLMFTLFKKSIFKVADLYNTLAQTTTDSNSLGAKIAASSNPIVKSVFFPIALYNPIPPFTSNKFSYIFCDIGAVFWYFMIPVSLYGMLFYKENKRLNYAFFFSLIILLMVLFITLGSFRHRLLITPIIILFYFVGNSEKTLLLNRIKYIHGTFLVVIFLIYFSLKLFL